MRNMLPSTKKRMEGGDPEVVGNGGFQEIFA
jgi:hypothetical protein